MHDEPIQLPSDERDENVQGAVLMHLLHADPAQLSIDELLRELITDANSFEERDAIARAVRDLSSAGLLHRNGKFVFPTRSATHFDQLRSL